MMNFNNPKTKRIVAGVIAAVLVVCMLLPLLASALQ